MKNHEEEAAQTSDKLWQIEAAIRCSGEKSSDDDRSFSFPLKVRNGPRRPQKWRLIGRAQLIPFLQELMRERNQPMMIRDILDAMLSRNIALQSVKQRACLATFFRTHRREFIYVKNIGYWPSDLPAAAHTELIALSAAASAPRKPRKREDPGQDPCDGTRDKPGEDTPHLQRMRRRKLADIETAFRLHDGRPSRLTIDGEVWQLLEIERAAQFVTGILQENRRPYKPQEILQSMIAARVAFRHSHYRLALRYMLSRKCGRFVRIPNAGYWPSDLFRCQPETGGMRSPASRGGDSQHALGSPSTSAIPR